MRTDSSEPSSQKIVKDEEADIDDAANAPLKPGAKNRSKTLRSRMPN